MVDVRNRTPGPWIVDEGRGGDATIVGLPKWPCRRFGIDGEWSIATVFGLSEDNDAAAGEGEANAAFIVLACNAHADLVEALQTIAAPIEGTPVGDPWDFYRDLQEVARAALNKVTQP